MRDKNTSIDIEKLCKSLDDIKEVEKLNEDTYLKKFLYKMFSSNNILNKDDIKNLNIEYIEDLINILEILSNNNMKVVDLNVNEEMYKEVIGIYRFENLLFNLTNCKPNKNNNIKASYMFF